MPCKFPRTLEHDWAISQDLKEMTKLSLKALVRIPGLSNYLKTHVRILIET